jgi:uncharacterized protein (DUF427 family)
MAEHINIRKAVGTWVVRAGGAVLGESSEALELLEGDLPPAVYFPRGDIAMAFLDASDTTSVCRHKGTASYYTIEAKSGPLTDAVWSYEAPSEGVERIAGYLAFDTGRVTVERV